jgi:hypothetical protein
VAKVELWLGGWLRYRWRDVLERSTRHAGRYYGSCDLECDNWRIARDLSHSKDERTSPHALTKCSLFESMNRQFLEFDSVSGINVTVKKYVVMLSAEERERLQTLIRSGKHPARKLMRARVLLKADASEAGSPHDLHKTARSLMSVFKAAGRDNASPVLPMLGIL